jgi:chromosome segregation ATPase
MAVSEAALGAAEGGKAAAEGEVASLQQQLAAATTALGEAKAAGAAATARADALDSDVATARADAAASAQQVASLREQMAVSEAALGAAEGGKAAAEGEVASLQQQLAAATAALGEAKAAGAAATADAATSAQQVASLREEMAVREAALSKEVAVVNNALTDARAYIAMVVDANAAQTERIAKLETAASTHAVELNAARQNADQSLKSTNAQLQVQVEAANASVDRLNAQIAELQAQLTTERKAALLEFDAEKVRLQTELATAHRAVSDAQAVQAAQAAQAHQEKIELQEQVANTNARISVAEAATEEAKAHVSASNALVETMRIEIETLTKANTDLVAFAQTMGPVLEAQYQERLQTLQAEAADAIQKRQAELEAQYQERLQKLQAEAADTVQERQAALQAQFHDAAAQASAIILQLQNDLAASREETAATRANVAAELERAKQTLQEAGQKALDAQVTSIRQQKDEEVARVRREAQATLDRVILENAASVESLSQANIRIQSLETQIATLQAAGVTIEQATTAMATVQKAQEALKADEQAIESRREDWDREFHETQALLKVAKIELSSTIAAKDVLDRDTTKTKVALAEAERALEAIQTQATAKNQELDIAERAKVALEDNMRQTREATAAIEAQIATLEADAAEKVKVMGALRDDITAMEARRASLLDFEQKATARLQQVQTEVQTLATITDQYRERIAAQEEEIKLARASAAERSFEQSTKSFRNLDERMAMAALTAERDSSILVRQRPVQPPSAAQISLSTAEAAIKSAFGLRLPAGAGSSGIGTEASFYPPAGAPLFPASDIFRALDASEVAGTIAPGPGPGRPTRRGDRKRREAGGDALQKTLEEKPAEAALKALKNVRSVIEQEEETAAQKRVRVKEDSTTTKPPPSVTLKPDISTFLRLRMTMDTKSKKAFAFYLEPVDPTETTPDTPDHVYTAIEHPLINAVKQYNAGTRKGAKEKLKLTKIFNNAIESRKDRLTRSNGLPLETRIARETQTLKTTIDTSWDSLATEKGTILEQLKLAIDYNVYLIVQAWWNKLVSHKSGIFGGRNPHVSLASPIHTKFSLFADKFGVQPESSGDIDTTMESGPVTPPPLSP